MSCRCGFTTDPSGECNGTHKIVKKVREKIANDISNAVIESAGDSAATMKQAEKIARG